MFFVVSILLCPIWCATCTPEAPEAISSEAHDEYAASFMIHTRTKPARSERFFQLTREAEQGLACREEAGNARSPTCGTAAVGARRRRPVRGTASHWVHLQVADAARDA